MNTQNYIGIFDSGVGGLTVAKAIGELMPHEHLLYYGDTLHMPYGTKTKDEINKYAENILAFFIAKNVKLVVIACNSASAAAAGYLRGKYWEKVHIIGVIRPVIKEIMKKNIKSLGIIGTISTINSHVYPQLFREYNYDIDIYEKATPLLASMIESGETKTTHFQETLYSYLQDRQFGNKEALLLACTHYPLISHEINTFFDGKKILLENALPLAKEVKEILESKNLMNNSRTLPNKFYVSKYTHHFEAIAKNFYHADIEIDEKNVH